MKDAGVRYAEPNWVYTKTATSNDFYFKKGYMVRRRSTSRPHQTVSCGGGERGIGSSL